MSETPAENHNPLDKYQRLSAQLESWRQRAVIAEQRLLEYGPLDRQFLEAQQQLMQLELDFQRSQQELQQAQERIIILERHILSLKASVGLTVPANIPKKRSSNQVRIKADLPSFLK